MNAEERLWNFYMLRREEWHGRFADALLAAKLKTYASMPRPQLLVALGKSMDLLLSSIRDRAIETYVNAMTANFKARVEQGLSREDLHAALEVAWRVYDALLVEAVADDDVARQQLRARGQRMKVATSVAFTQVLFSK